jgi:hypothetical protein
MDFDIRMNRLILVIVCALSFFYLLTISYTFNENDSKPPAREPVDKSKNRAQLDVKGEPGIVVSELKTVKRVHNQGKKTFIPANEYDKTHDTMGRLYKWKNSNNTIVISMEPPPSDIQASVFLFSRENDITKESVEGTPIISKFEPNKLTVPVLINNPLKVYTPDGLREFIKYSQAIGEKIELRGAELDELIKQL